MMRGGPTSARALTEAGMTVGITVILSLLGVYVPVFSVVTWLLWPIPTAFLGIRHGMRWSTLAASATVLILMVLVGPVAAAGVGLTFGPMGILLGEGFRQKWGASKMLLSATTVFICGFLIQLAVAFYIMDVDIIEMYRNAVQVSTNEAFATLESMGYNSIELAKAKENYLAQQAQMRQLIPFLLLSSGLLAAFLDIKIARSVLRRLRVPLPPFPPVAEWEMPRAAFYLYIVAVVIEYMGGGWGAWVVPAAINLKVACMYVIWLQGVAVLFWLCRKFPMMGPVKWIVLVAAFFIPLFMAVLFFGGLIDIAINYRRNRQYR